VRQRLKRFTHLCAQSLSTENGSRLHSSIGYDTLYSYLYITQVILEKVKGKVLTYSLPSVGRGVQAVPVYRQSAHSWL